MRGLEGLCSALVGLLWSGLDASVFDKKTRQPTVQALPDVSVGS